MIQELKSKNMKLW